MATPEKRKAQQQGANNSSRKHYMKSSLKQKRTMEQFQPNLYITRELNESDIIMIKEAFDHHDSNKMGLLNPNDLKQALFSHNFYANIETVYNLIAEYDEEGLGGLTFDAFIRVIGSDPTQTETTMDLKKTFRKYDRQNKGFITSKDVLDVAKSLGEKMSVEESEALFAVMDRKKAGKVSFEEFCVLMHHPDSLR